MEDTFKTIPNLKLEKIVLKQKNIAYILYI